MSEEFGVSETPRDPTGGSDGGKKKNNTLLFIVIGVVVFAVLCVLAIFGSRVFKSLETEFNNTVSTVQAVGTPATKTPMPKGTATSAFDDSRPTITAQPTQTKVPASPTVQPDGATATPLVQVNPTQTVIPQVWGMLTWHDTVPQTPCPDCGPYVDPTEAPTVPVLAMKNDSRDFIRFFINEYVRYMTSQGRRPMLYHVVNDIFPWFPVSEREIGNKWSVTTEGGTWYDCSFPKGGCHVSGMGESVFTADLATCYADASVAGVVPFYPNSTMGGYGAMETVVDVEVSFTLGNGVLYVPDGAGLTVTNAGGSCQ